MELTDEQRLFSIETTQPDVKGAIAYARDRMERELPPEMTYHNLAHTFEEVLPAALHLAELCHLEDGNADLVAVAAAYHDIGRVLQAQEHEAIGAGIARAVLPRFGFDSEQIDAIAEMILATRLPQSPQTLSEQILADADLDILGQKDFMSRNADLKVELVAQGRSITQEGWLRAQLQFLESHLYYTEAARLLRDKQKSKNIAAIKQLLEALPSDQSQPTSRTRARPAPKSATVPAGRE